MLSDLKSLGYQFITLAEHFEGHGQQSNFSVINRIDVDLKIDRLRSLREILRKAEVRASIFVRLHSPSYNLLNFGTLCLLRELIAEGHEIGLHTELMDAQGYLRVDAGTLLRTEISLLECLLNTRIKGTAAHGDMTPHNNLHFWQRHNPKDFGLLYEAYDQTLWKNSRYISDSEWTQWKAYQNGELMEGDRRTPHRHAVDDAPPRIYLLTHPESWYEHYIHE